MSILISQCLLAQDIKVEDVVLCIFTEEGWSMKPKAYKGEKKIQNKTKA